MIYHSFSEAIDYGKKNKQNLLVAHGELNLAMFFFGQFYSNYLSDNHFEKNIEVEFISIVNSAINAYNMFKELHMEPLAYNAITLVKELYILAEKWIGLDLEGKLSKDMIDKCISSFSEYDFAHKYESLILQAEKRKNEVFNTEYLANNLLSTEEIEEIVQIQIRMFGFPPERAENIALSVEASSMFKVRCHNPDLILSSDQNPNSIDSYRTRPKFRICTKSTDILVAEGYNIDSMLKSLGY